MVIMFIITVWHTVRLISAYASYSFISFTGGCSSSITPDDEVTPVIRIHHEDINMYAELEKITLYTSFTLMQLFLGAF